jgi:5'-3' exonuclease
MSDMNFICPTCKRATHPTDNEISEHLAKEIDRYVEVLIERTKELDRTRKVLDVAVDGLEKMTWGCDSSDAEHLLKEITALEQKD